MTCACRERAWRALAGLGAIELPDKLTPMSAADASKALASAYKRVTGAAADAKLLGLLVGQTALETGNWKSLHNWNFGNAKATSSDPYYQNFRCWEVVGGEKVWYDAGHPACRFAAHPTAVDGAEHYIRVLKHRPNWWDGLQTRSVEGFVDGLTKVPYAYFTADKGTYSRVLAERMGQYTSEIKAFAGTPAGMGAAVGAFAVVFGGLYLYRRSQRRAA